MLLSNFHVLIFFISPFYQFNFVCLKFMRTLLFFWIFLNLFPFILLSSLQLQTCCPFYFSFPRILVHIYFPYYNLHTITYFTINLICVFLDLLYIRLSVIICTSYVISEIELFFNPHTPRSYVALYLLHFFTYLSSLQLQTRPPLFFNTFILLITHSTSSPIPLLYVLSWNYYIPFKHL